jgi:hypothetical protein
VKPLSRALILFLFQIATGAAGVNVQVTFQNGDRLSGELRRADALSVELRPAVPGLGDSLKLGWQADAIATLELGSSGSSSACLYLSPSRQSNRISRLPGGQLCFKSAVATRQRGADRSLHLTAKLPEPKGGNASTVSPHDESNYLWIKSLDIIAPRDPQATTPSPPITATAAQPSSPSPGSGAPAAPAGPFLSTWSVNINAPESITQGTQSQQLFGGLFRTDAYAGDQNHFTVVAAGTHQHNLSLHKPPQRTDIFDSLAQFSHSYANQFGVYGISEWFFNSSLGMAAERSAGGGILFPGFHTKSENLTGRVWVDVRYFNERLYTSRKLNLIGSVVHGELNYFPTSGNWFLTLGLMAKPMFNDRGATQTSGSLTFTLPLGHHVCATLTPVDDTYMGNSPTGFRRNYLKSSAGLQILAGSNPGQKCK